MYAQKRRKKVFDTKTRELPLAVLTGKVPGRCFIVMKQVFHLGETTVSLG